MKIKMKAFTKVTLLIAGLIFLAGCSHTVEGMRQDIHEDSAPPPPKHHTTKVIEVTAPQDLPASPPPLETPTQ